MKAFVTGGSGFVGQHVVRKLVERGYDVHALVRSKASADIVEALGATVVPGDITDVESMREGMAGSDVVFHIAGWYKIGASDWTEAEVINVSGTRKVLRLAHQSGVPKIVYTSTVTAFGDTKGQLVDESFYQGGPFLTEYDRTKWLAHYKVALPLIEKGAPIIIVMPGGIFGPGDTSAIGEMMRLFYRGLPVVPGPSTTLTYAHVEDVAEGHILAAEQGKIGESYILAGPAIPLGEMIDYWAYLLGRRAPLIRIPAGGLRPFAPLLSSANNLLPLPGIFSGEATRSLGVTYMARSDKARRELGWQTRPLQTGMLETFQWIAETEAERPDSKEKQIALLALVIAFSLALVWLFGRRRDEV
jgi:nucleoside-diphosphate-sugar epimerase